MYNEIGRGGWFKDGEALFLVINEQLPSLNEYIGKCRTNPHVGAKFKSEVENTICDEILLSRAAGYLRKIRSDEYPLQVEILWSESTAKRDVDNVKSAAKFIMDALKKADIITDDGQKYVAQIYDRVKVNRKAKTTVYVKILPKTVWQARQEEKN